MNRAGQTIRLRDKYTMPNETELDRLYVIIEDNEDRVLAKPLNWNTTVDGTIVPTELFTNGMFTNKQE